MHVLLKKKHSLEISEMYENLSLKISEFKAKGSRIALFGDFNARLGSYSGDHATNSNAGQFKSFEEIHSLFLLNKLFCHGKPTYVKPTSSVNATSIIDFGLTDSIGDVVNFGVSDTVFGIDAQKAHRLIFKLNPI